MSEAGHPKNTDNRATGASNDKATNFRRLADEAAKDAAEAADPQARKSYLDVARNWLRLAAMAERRSNARPL